MKYKLGYKFLKTTPKANTLKNYASIIRTFVFVKSFIKCIQLDLNPIFLDESNFQMVNNKLKIWRKKNEGVTFNVGKPGRKNIILAVTQNKKIYYEINDGTNKILFKFFNNLLKNITPKELKHYFFIMDNCTIHLNKALIDFYKNNKLKIITIVPYFSELNSVELCFRFLKQKMIKKIYKNINKLTSDVKDLVDSEKFHIILPKLFLETLKKYLTFLNKHLFKELNHN